MSLNIKSLNYKNKFIFSKENSPYDFINWRTANKYNIIIFLLLLFINCENSKPYIKAENKNIEIDPNKSNLILDLSEIQDPIISYEKMELSFMEDSPTLIKTTRTDFVTLPVPGPIRVPVNVETNEAPIVRGEFLFQNILESKGIYQFTTEKEGEYFASLYNMDSFFEFSPMEEPNLLVTFGYIYALDEKTFKYNLTPFSGKCTNKYEHFGWERRHLHNNNSCGKLILKKGKTTIIKIKSSGRIRNDLATLIIKWIPGIVILGPLTNRPDPYYHRKYKVELINPE